MRRQRAISFSMQTPLELTANAATRITHLAQKKANPALALRLMVDSGGCSGLQYKFSLDDKPPAPDDICIVRDAATLRIDPVSLDYLKGSVIDYVSDLSGAMFVVKNPNAESGCGCGVSFTVKT